MRIEKEILEVVLAMREWIDTVPSDTVLPCMPGFDRDWADEVIEKYKCATLILPGE